MAVEVSRVLGRLKALFPKANLSKQRLDVITAKLAKKPEDDADDAAIDEVLQDYNDNGAMTFEEIAKADDKIRTLEASKPVEQGKPAKTVTDPDEPAWFTKYKEEQEAKIANLEAARTKETIQARFEKDERVKGIPDFIKKGYVPSSDEDFETKVTELVEAYRPFAEKNKLEGFGADTPAASTDSTESKGKVKQMTPEEAKAVVKGM